MLGVEQIHCVRISVFEHPSPLDTLQRVFLVGYVAADSASREFSLPINLF
jgi:hypothetical protein